MILRLLIILILLFQTLNLCGKDCKISIIIDDIGADIKKAIKIWEINSNITLSIIPFLKDAKKISFYAELNSLPVMLHFPMEPENFHNDKLNRFYLLTSFSYEKFIKIENYVLKMIPYYEGINNHMGSKLTENETCMDWFFSQIKNKNIFFIDSRTTPKSVAGKIALKYNLLCGIRDVFLDNEKDVNAILIQLKKLVRIAEKDGYAIGIGHPFNETIKALKIFLKSEDVELIPPKEGLHEFKNLEIKLISQKE